MRVAVISDVHGNAFALEQVIGDLRSESPDLILNLGDQVYGRADPARAFEMQRNLRAVEVLGNCELLLEGEDALASWIRGQIPPESLEHLTGLPLTARVLDGEILACHGDLTDPNGQLFWSWQGGPYSTETIVRLPQNGRSSTRRTLRRKQSFCSRVRKFQTKKDAPKCAFTENLLPISRV
ncbi:MAG: metallophosphoesterase family protein [Pseudopedobacter sp.]|nr:metallophosphoesterase family protein [Deinococcales bacterium]